MLILVDFSPRRRPRPAAPRDPCPVWPPPPRLPALPRAPSPSVPGSSPAGAPRQLRRLRGQCPPLPPGAAKATRASRPGESLKASSSRSAPHGAGTHRPPPVHRGAMGRGCGVCVGGARPHAAGAWASRYARCGGSGGQEPVRGGGARSGVGGGKGEIDTHCERSCAHGSCLFLTQGASASTNSI